jgi:hypothetical protein
MPALLAALMVAAIARDGNAQEPVSNLARNGAPVVRANAAAPRAESAQASEIAIVRRQPKSLLAGIVLSRSEKKAVNGILRRNDRVLSALAKRQHQETDRVARARIEREIIDVRDRERGELRALLNDAQRVRFDRNVARLDGRAT